MKMRRKKKQYTPVIRSLADGINGLFPKDYLTKSSPAAALCFYRGLSKPLSDLFGWHRRNRVGRGVTIHLLHSGEIGYSAFRRKTNFNFLLPL